MAEYQELYKKYRPRKWEDVIGQDKTINGLRESVVSGKVPTAYLFAGGPGTGKALHKETYIPTPHGFVQLNKIKVGERIFGSNGQPTRVLDKYCPMDPESFLLKFDTGEEVKASGGHLWVVNGKTITTKEIFEQLIIDPKTVLKIGIMTAPALWDQLTEQTREKLKTTTESLKNFYENPEMTEIQPNMDIAGWTFSSLGFKVYYEKTRIRLSNEQWYRIVGCTPIQDNPEDYYCLSVEAEDKLFLCTKSFIPTHNTTTALILAKALNCDDVDENGNPCNKCNTCLSIDNNSCIGVKYVSMANYGSADDVRRIVEEARLNQPVKKQVMILDETQNLSNAAFDSLLLPLESEQMKTLFVFCTTEPEKIRPAVLSRLQIRNFAPISLKNICNHIMRISEAEGMGLSKDQIISIGKSANGSVRNAIQNMETMALDGVLPSDYSNKFFDLLLKGEPSNLFLLTNEMSENGQNFVKITEEIYREFTSSLYVLSGGRGSQYSTEIAKELGAKFILSALTIVGEGLTLMASRVVDGRIVFEITMTKLLLLKSRQK